MSKTRTKNPNWKRTTGNQRRAGVVVCRGGTYNVGRNASKRANRRADINARVAARKAR